MKKRKKMKNSLVFGDIDWFFHSIIQFESRDVEFESSMQFTETGKLIGLIIFFE